MGVQFLGQEDLLEKEVAAHCEAPLSWDSRTGNLGLISGSGSSPEEGNGNPLQYSCLENPMTEEPGEL